MAVIYKSNEQILIEIKKIMLETKTTQREIADKLGIKPQGLTKILNKKNFSFEDAQKILATMGYDLVIDFKPSMGYILKDQSSGLSPKATPSEPATRHPEPEPHEREAFPRPPAPDHSHIEAKTESNEPASTVEKLEQLRRKTMEAMADQHSKAGNGHIPIQKGEPDTQRRKPEYGSGDNSHIPIGGGTDMPDPHRETFEEKMERLSKSHPLKMDGVVQRQ